MRCVHIDVPISAGILSAPYPFSAAKAMAFLLKESNWGFTNFRTKVVDSKSFSN